MKLAPQIVLRILLDVKREHGDLEKGLVAYCVRVEGEMSINAMAQHLGLSRHKVRKHLQELSDSDT